MTYIILIVNGKFPLHKDQNIFTNKHIIKNVLLADFTESGCSLKSGNFDGIGTTKGFLYFCKTDGCNSEDALLDIHQQYDKHSFSGYIFLLLLQPIATSKNEFLWLVAMHTLTLPKTGTDW